ncbi:hypothetical protein GO730_20765 [Spirosoma sp. HMF3257]|uniref:Uncharacterized protein n=1 Tax=Spirosoma telluris TaxID=2183553 RepID=A0A327NKS9_9BACT|nr:hypothetical protein [Spirosoma telluris]RAI75981.1 hypothetical protein HMF3257_20690 [Spirosoma telluris]
MNPKPKAPVVITDIVGLVQSQNSRAQVTHLFIEEAVGGAHDYSLTIVAPKINMAGMLLTGNGFRILNLESERVGENVVAVALVTVWDLK